MSKKTRNLPAIPSEMPPKIEQKRVDVIYSDNHVLVAVKPAGWLTQPDDTGRISLEAAAKDWVKKEYHKPGAVYLHCIHRIDRPVFGLVIFARTSKALSRLNESSRANLIRRFYVAEVEGIVTPKEAVLEHHLLHGDHKAIVTRARGSKKAILTYHTLAQKQHSTSVAIELQTGRYHQIRAQFSAIGHPIVGDKKYGAHSGSGDEIHLACTDLSFPHPVTKEQLEFHVDSPF